MRNALSQVCTGLAAAAALLLPLIALQIAQHTPLGLRRFREPSLAVLAFLLLAIVVAPEPRARFARMWTAAQGLLSRPRFFPAAAAAMGALFALSVVERHLAFRTFSHDFGMLDDAITLLPGRPLLFSPILGRSFLSEHFSPILLALVPVRALIPSPYVLLLAQAGALWGAAILLRRLLLADGHPPALANLAFVLWLCQPHVVSTLEYVAHMESFLPLFALGAWLAMRRRRPWRAAAFLLGALLVKEDVGLYVAGAGAYLALTAGEGGPAPAFPPGFVRGAGIALALAGAAWTFVAVDLVIPAFAPAGEGFRFATRWSHWGDSPLAIVAGWAAQPAAFARALFGVAPLRVVATMVFLPFLPRFGWLLFAAPWIVNATSNDGAQSGLSLYYGIPLVTFATLAAVEGLRSEPFRRLALYPRVLAAMAVAAIVLNVAHFTFPRVAAGRGAFLRAAAAVPDGAAVRTMSCLYPALGARLDRRVVDDADVPLDAPWLALRTRATTWPLSGAGAEALLDRARTAGYETIVEADGAYLLRAPQR